MIRLRIDVIFSVCVYDIENYDGSWWKNYGIDAYL